MQFSLFNADAKPFIKWAGGKTQILHEIRAKYPIELGKTITKYAEPFIGGGAVLFDILNHYELAEVYISDINKELINTYICIRDEADLLINLLQEYESNYLSANEIDRKEKYYQKREYFNNLKINFSNKIELAALFIFLNRTCFNGLYRVNGRGDFNVPQGDYKNPTICDASNIWAVSEKLKRVTIVCADYKNSGDFIDDKTFVYFDPPYRPLSTTSNFTSYAQNGFDDEAQTELAYFIDMMSERGACVAASNSDPTNTDKNDNFFDLLYAKYNIKRISATRMINSDADSRGKLNELLITNIN